MPLDDVWQRRGERIEFEVGVRDCIISTGGYGGDARAMHRRPRSSAERDQPSANLAHQPVGCVIEYMYPASTVMPQTWSGVSSGATAK